MNREDIICMAQEAGAIPIHKDYSQKALVGNENIERFAVLVASAERDRMCEQFNLSKELAHEKAKSNEAN